MTAMELALDRAIDELLRDGAAPAPEADVEPDLLAGARFVLGAVEHVPISAGDTALARALNVAPPVRSRRARWIVALPALAALGLGSVAFAARGALPGDALFGVRRRVESARVVLTVGAPAHAMALLERAAGDLDFARRLLDGGRVRDAAESLELFDRDLAAARRAIALLADADRRPLRTRADALAGAATSLRERLSGGTDDAASGPGAAEPGESGSGGFSGSEESRESSGPDSVDSDSGGTDESSESGSSDSGSPGSGESGPESGETEAGPSPSPTPSETPAESPEPTPEPTPSAGETPHD